MTEILQQGTRFPGPPIGPQVVDSPPGQHLVQFYDGEEPDWDRFLAEIGGAAARSIVASPSGRVRAYGEMVDLLCRRGLYRAALQLEEFWNRLQGQYPLSLLCAYVMGSFFSESQSADFRQVCERHDQVFPANEPRMDPEAQLRQISLLQQRALALETELLRRKRSEEHRLNSSHSSIS